MPKRFPVPVPQASRVKLRNNPFFGDPRGVLFKSPFDKGGLCFINHKPPVNAPIPERGRAAVELPFHSAFALAALNLLGKLQTVIFGACLQNGFKYDAFRVVPDIFHS